LLGFTGPLMLQTTCHTSSNSGMKKKNSVVLVRKRTIPSERPQPVGEVSANFS
jgi:hypothetical protein